jgi:hypothetical protein
VLLLTGLLYGDSGDNDFRLVMTVCIPFASLHAGG